MKLYPWLYNHYIKLIKSYKNELMHHNLLLYSNFGNGVDFLCKAIINWLFCQNKNEFDICNICHNCHLIASGNHPDYHILKPENDKINISVDDIRKLIEKINNYAKQGVKKIIYIPNIELLSDSAANSLLKTLEEPTKNTYFIIKHEKQYNIFPTIRSRCINYTIHHPNQEEIFLWLKTQLINLDKNIAITAIKLSNYAPLLSLELLNPNNWLRREKLCYELKIAIKQRNFLKLIKILNTDFVLKNIKWLLTIILDAIKFHQKTIEFCVNCDQLELVTIFFKSIKIKKLLISYKQWQNCYYKLLTINSLKKELILINQLIQWEALIYTL